MTWPSWAKLNEKGLAQYALPGVAILYDTDTGYHGITFAVSKEPAGAETASP